MQLNLINILELSLISKFSRFFTLRDERSLVLILNANLSVIIVLASEEDVLLWFNFQVVAASKRMDFSFEIFSVFNDSCFFVADSDDVDTLI